MFHDLNVTFSGLLFLALSVSWDLIPKVILWVNLISLELNDLY